MSENSLPPQRISRSLSPLHSPCKPESRSRSPEPESRSRPVPPRKRSRSNSRGQGSPERQNTTLFVTGLSSRVTEKVLHQHFSKEGKVVSCFLVKKPHSPISRGHGFVTMYSHEDALRCIKCFNQTLLEGRRITVKKSRRNRPISLFVTGLDSRVTEFVLHEHFSKKGKVVSCFLVKEPHSHISCGYGFVTMSSYEDAQRCIRYFDQTLLEGRHITVEKSRRNCPISLFVTGLHSRVTEKILHEHFSKEGEVVSCFLVKKPHSQISRGHGFVKMSSHEDAQRCIRCFDQTLLEGRRITVKKSRRNRPKSPTPRYYVGHSRPNISHDNDNHHGGSGGADFPYRRSPRWP